MNCSPPGSSVHGTLQAFSRQEHWSGLPFPSPGDLADPGIEPGSPHCRQILYHLSHHRNIYIPQNIFPVPWTPAQKRHISVLSAWVLRPQRGTGTNLPHGFVDASMQVNFHIFLQLGFISPANPGSQKLCLNESSGRTWCLACGCSLPASALEPR